MSWVSLVSVFLVLDILKKEKKSHLIIVFKSLGIVNIYVYYIYLLKFNSQKFFKYLVMMLKFVIVAQQNVVDTSVRHHRLQI